MGNDSVQLMEIFSKQLKKLLEENHISQADLAETLNVSESTVGKWILMKALPRMGIIEKLSAIFNKPKSYFLEEPENNTGHYVNPETAEAAQRISENEGLRILFDTVKDLPPENLEAIVDLVKKFKK